MKVIKDEGETFCERSNEIFGLLLELDTNSLIVKLREMQYLSYTLLSLSKIINTNRDEILLFFTI